MKNVTTFKIELDIAAQKVIHQFMTGNEAIEEQLSNAIHNAIDTFDFQKEVEGIVKRQLREALNNSFTYGKLHDLVQAKTNAIYTKLIDAEFKKYES